MARVIHRIWCGPPMPPEYERFGARWRELNPGWMVHDWTEDEIRDTIWQNQDVIDDLYERDQGRRSIALFAQLADVVSYELLHLVGGIYVNADVEPVKELATMEKLYELDLEADAWATREDASWLVNAVMGAPRAHDFFGAVIEYLPRRYWSNRLAPMNKTTGPALLTSVADIRSDLVVLDEVAFNPHHWKTIPKGSDASGRKIPAATIGVHHWGHRRDGRTNLIEKG